MRRRAVLALVLVVCTACSRPEPEAQLLPFASGVDRPPYAALLSMEVDGVSIDLYDNGECATIIEHVPEYGYLVDEFCPDPPLPDVGGARFGTPNCPMVDFGDECVRWLPTFTIGRTVDEAAYVCVASGRLEVRDGWWMTANEDGTEAFPFSASGVRLDPVENEFDDRIRERCEVES